jgi:hypothetical protein
MLEELAALLVVSRPANEPAPGCQPSLEVVSLGIEKLLMDTRSPATAAHSPQLSLVQELPQLTSPRVEQLDVKGEITVATRNPNDTTPTPCEAARRHYTIAYLQCPTVGRYKSI